VHFCWIESAQSKFSAHDEKCRDEQCHVSSAVDEHEDFGFFVFVLFFLEISEMEKERSGIFALIPIDVGRRKNLEFVVGF